MTQAEKNLLNMYCLKPWKERQPIHIVALLFEKARLFTLYHVLNTIKGNFKTIRFVRTFYIRQQSNSYLSIFSLCNL